MNRDEKRKPNRCSYPLGANFSGVLLAAPRRKLCRSIHAHRLVPSRWFNESDGGTPSTARETRALPNPTASPRLKHLSFDYLYQGCPMTMPGRRPRSCRPALIRVHLRFKFPSRRTNPSQSGRSWPSPRREKSPARICFPWPWPAGCQSGNRRYCRRPWATRSDKECCR